MNNRNFRQELLDNGYSIHQTMKYHYSVTKDTEEELFRDLIGETVTTYKIVKQTGKTSGDYNIYTDINTHNGHHTKFLIPNVICYDSMSPCSCENKICKHIRDDQPKGFHSYLCLEDAKKNAKSNAQLKIITVSTYLCDIHDIDFKRKHLVSRSLILGVVQNS